MQNPLTQCTDCEENCAKCGLDNENKLKALMQEIKEIKRQRDKYKAALATIINYAQNQIQRR